MRTKRKRRIVAELPASLMKEIRRARVLIAEELPELIKKGERLDEAKREPTLSGALRRAIHTSKILLPDLADRAGTDMKTIDAFLTGDRPLTSDVMDRLTKVLKLKLEPANGKPKSRRAKAG